MASCSLVTGPETLVPPSSAAARAQTSGRARFWTLTTKACGRALATTSSIKSSFVVVNTQVAGSSGADINQLADE